MPGPVFRGRCIVEVVVPAKTVIQHDCERCSRTWYSDTEKKPTRLLVSMSLSDGSTLQGDFGTLCDSCEKTAAHGVKALLRNMKKNSPVKSGAKKRGAAAPSPESSPVTPLGDGQVRTSAVEATPPSPRVPSKRS